MVSVTAITSKCLKILGIISLLKMNDFEWGLESLLADLEV